MNVLFTNAGRRTYLIEDALELRKSTNLIGDIYVCDTSLMTASMWVSREVKRLITPRVSENPHQYVDILLKKCLKHEISAVFPLMDLELQILAENKKKFSKKGIDIVVSSKETIESSIDKSKCYKQCISNSLSVPSTYYEGEIVNKSEVPLIMKPKKGSGSEGIRTVRKESECPDYVPDGYIMQRFIEGEEYGMDVLNTVEGKFCHCCIRKKSLMRAGETDKAEVIYRNQFFEAGKKIGEIFGHVGNMDVDFIVNEDGSVYFIDFNPRFGGGYPFTRAAGFNYLKALLKNLSGEEIDFDRVGKEVAGAKGLKLFTYKK
jgi:carbamoyl-phosphate synthase large subunit